MPWPRTGDPVKTLGEKAGHGRCVDHVELK